ncbi:hypothetical protein P691DRAFT_809672, partial [Macrolepiota fuliginosa MF-IS2]
MFQYPLDPFWYGVRWKALAKRHLAHPLTLELDGLSPRRISRPDHMVLHGSKAIL